MSHRRRALRDHLDPRPLVGTAGAAIREAEQAIASAREGLLRHFESDAQNRIISQGTTPPKSDSASTTSWDSGRF
jgi:hypothetical protein